MMKKGQINNTLLAVFLLLGIGAAGLFIYQGLQQSAVAGVEQQQQITQQLISPTGKAATVRYAALDQESSPKNTQVAVSGIYALEMNGDTQAIISNNVTSSATARTSVSTSTGKTLKAVAFSNAYYGDMVETKVDKETINIDLPVHTIATGINVSLEDVDGVVRTDTNLNMTLVANEKDSWSWLKIKNTDTNSQFRWKALGFDLATAANISNVDVAGMTSSNVPERRRSVVDYYFVFPEAQKLSEFDSVKTGRVLFESDGDNPAESITLYVVDEQHFKAQDNTLKVGVEDDQNTPADIGASDVTRTLNIL